MLALGGVCTRSRGGAGPRFKTIAQVSCQEGLRKNEAKVVPRDGNEKMIGGRTPNGGDSSPGVEQPTGLADCGSDPRYLFCFAICCPIEASGSGSI